MQPNDEEIDMNNSLPPLPFPDNPEENNGTQAHYFPSYYDHHAPYPPTDQGHSSHHVSYASPDLSHAFYSRQISDVASDQAHPSHRSSYLPTDRAQNSYPSSYYQAQYRPGSHLSSNHSGMTSYPAPNQSSTTAYHLSPDHHGSPRIPGAQQSHTWSSINGMQMAPAMRRTHAPPGYSGVPAAIEPNQPPSSGALPKTPATPAKSLAINSDPGPDTILKCDVPITLDYLVYSKTMAFQLAEATSSTPLEATNKDWDKMIPNPKVEIVWNVDLAKYKWSNFKNDVIDHLDGTREFLGAHLTALDAARLLTWHCVLIRDPVYGVKANVAISSDDQFSGFVSAVKKHPTWKVLVKIAMEHPASHVKVAEVQQKGNDSLKMSYATDNDRLKLQALQARKTANPKADLTASETAGIVQQIVAHIIAKYDCTSETLRVRDPDNPLRSIHVTTGLLWDWARCMQAKATHIGLDRPPAKAKDYQPEDVQVFTREEEAAGASTRKTPKNKGRRRLPAPDSDGDSSPAQTFTPARFSANGRILPRKLVCDSPAALPPSGKTPAILPSRANSLASLPSDVHDLIETDELASTTSDSGDVSIQARTTRLRKSRAGSTGSTNIEIVPAEDPEHDRSPARKIAKSPGNGITQPISRLNFHHRRGVRQPSSISPQGRQGGSRVPSGSSLNAPTGVAPIKPHIPASPARKARLLNDAARALTMEEFLDASCFDRNDSIPRCFISLNHIRHWDFFYSQADFASLVGMGFPPPIAGQLLRGAAGLEATHVQAE
ncbi:hypothetical protein Pst134EA_011721 [Puccinia striiformis f. sp. tritici]|uniref:Uncharacterized protein n=1 Tax=Puccinia striiformis f. sp. tritici PST-78 TaxID=1165861 RepID=A0A0L0VUX4_9BASI|nr:hypothetical protein Pst134EA_011721 [Puccinia striiformis f. sp. tritici]KAH9468099.1 hypothetical protein Pst134EA_011721 [Puccinia striiformis f. sp. tritici]KNF03099.1 hypothetical protein PSTG_03683 [Puccinia striiformis f. sp. tritici PST-78]